MSSTAAVTQLHEQLTFEVGGIEDAPGQASIAITGSGEVGRDLHLDAGVAIKVVDSAGVIVATFSGTVVDVGFKKHPAKVDKDGIVTQDAFVERKHKIKLDPED